ncbi:hypothetical protein HDZ31DRAFT_27602, partial [Schizophyllum fasciatum]
MAEMARQYHLHLQDDGPGESNWNLPDQREADIQTALDAFDARVLEEEVEELEEGIDRDEVERALQFAKNKSAPGIDGIPYEFWKIVNDRFIEDVRCDRPAFDVVALLLAAFRNIQANGLEEESKFAE